MAERFKGLENRKKQRGVRIEDDGISLHENLEVERIFIDRRGNPRTEIETVHEVQLICDLCSRPIRIDNVVRFLKRVYHPRCAFIVVDQVLDRQDDFDAETVARAQALYEQLKPNWLDRFLGLFGLRRKRGDDD